MDLPSTIALSLLPGISRVRAAAVFKELHDSPDNHGLALEHVIEACDPEADATVAATALTNG